MMLTGSCHCGAVRIVLPKAPAYGNACNCSICRRYGVIWGYYHPGEVGLPGEPGATEPYAWGPKELVFDRCRACGCVVSWRSMAAESTTRMGVNLRLFDPADLAGVPLKHGDGASS